MISKYLWSDRPALHIRPCKVALCVTWLCLVTRQCGLQEAGIGVRWWIVSASAHRVAGSLLPGSCMDSLHFFSPSDKEKARKRTKENMKNDKFVSYFQGEQAGPCDLSTVCLPSCSGAWGSTGNSLQGSDTFVCVCCTDENWTKASTLLNRFS